MKSNLTRRRVLRGMLNGCATTVAIPLLDCFLNTNGNAFAAGEALPVRFGTWFWGLGMDQQIYVPKKVGADYDLPEQLAPIRDVRNHVNVFTGFDVLTDGRPNLCHYTGWVAQATGEAPLTNGRYPGQSIDTTVSDAIGTMSRYRSLQVTATGDARSTHSFRNSDAVNPADGSPLELYQRVFGPEFVDPNAPEFTPDPRLMVRKSALSTVMEQSADLRKTLGKADQARLDEHFTAIRALEKRLELQLQKPPPAEACNVPGAPKGNVGAGMDAELVASRHDLMTDVLVNAIACNQTRVFNMVYSNSFADTTKKGESRPHHPATHEEARDASRGYQLESAWFVTRAMESWASFVGALARVKEGDGTLLDRSLIFAYTDCQLAQIHSLQGVPVMTAGSAAGKIKTGLHVQGNGTPATRIGLTAMQAVGVQISEWGANSMKTSRVVDEVVA